jgi:hypothetical protein
MPDITTGQLAIDQAMVPPPEEDVGTVQAIIAQVQYGFSIAVDLRGGQQHDMWRGNFVASFAEAEKCREDVGVTARCFLGEGLVVLR